MTHAKIQSQWDRRARRANELIDLYPFAAEGLRFYAQIVELQSALYSSAAKTLANPVAASPRSSLRAEIANRDFLARFTDFVAAVQQFAPKPLANAAADLAAKGRRVRQPLDNFLADGFNLSIAANNANENGSEWRAHETLLAWLFLQPFAEYLAERGDPPTFDSTPSCCPVCGSNPIVGVLRPEGDGGKKSLICMLCAHEWVFRRIYCPACGEAREPQMGFFAAPENPHVRVDVCDTCHSYLKTVDLTKMGRAVPVVDELATIPLDLWAREHGYEKLQMDMLGA